MTKKEEIMQEIKDLLRDKYKGLRQTSNTNKSYYNILAMIEDYDEAD